MAVESRQCPRCQNFDTLVPLTDEENDAKTTKHGAQLFAVKQLRCVACGLSDLVERDFRRAHQNDPEPIPGKPSASDGHHFVVTPIDPPPESGAPHD
jgi:Zn ribbon nucleic-acid-binding protein